MAGTTERSAAEIRGLLRFEQGPGLDEAAVREIYEAVGEQVAEAGVGDDDRTAELQKPMLAAAKSSPLSFANWPSQGEFKARQILRLIV
ncbi:hypothetical protein FHR71_000876 [Methylobacterium sp. RAS18]|nr:hypothetical protein [Methylobacterium sp. RAS18]